METSLSPLLNPPLLRLAAFYWLCRTKIQLIPWPYDIPGKCKSLYHVVIEKVSVHKNIIFNSNLEDRNLFGRSLFNLVGIISRIFRTKLARTVTNKTIISPQKTYEINRHCFLFNNLS